MPGRKKQMFLLIHRTDDGCAPTLFTYNPTAENPWPDAIKVAKYLKLPITADSDELELVPCHRDWVEYDFLAHEVGTPDLVDYFGPTHLKESL